MAVARKEGTIICMSFLKWRWRTFRVPFLFFVIGIALGALAFSPLDPLVVSDSCGTSKFTYINPELGCAESISDQRGYAELKSRLEDFIREKTESGDVSTVSIYFRDLKNGPTLGINEHENFAPASLLKLPMLLTYLSYGETHPGFLETQLEYDNYEDDLTQSIVPEESIIPNTPYTINEMLRYMIEYSDNRSYYALFNYIFQVSPDIDLLKDAYIRLGIVDPKDAFDQTIEVKQYSSIFLQLYNASFFDNKETSERALDLLVHSTFDKGIVAGVPSDIVVAHKFGERSNFSQVIKQLHDCGIVYLPRSPYLICVMTRGADMDKLAEVISTISGMFYEEVYSRRVQ